MSDLSAEQWNERHPVGTWVRFDNRVWDPIVARTTSSAVRHGGMGEAWKVRLGCPGDPETWYLRNAIEPLDDAAVAELNGEARRNDVGVALFELRAAIDKLEKLLK